MSKTQWGAVAVGVSSLVVLSLSMTPTQSHTTGPLVETSPGVYSQGITATVGVPTWAKFTSAVLLGLAGVLMYVGRTRGAP